MTPSTRAILPCLVEAELFRPRIDLLNILLSMPYRASLKWLEVAKSPYPLVGGMYLPPAKLTDFLLNLVAMLDTA